MNDTLQPGQSYSLMLGKEPRFNESTKVYSATRNKCQHMTQDNYETDQQESKSFNFETIE